MKRRRVKTNQAQPRMEGLEPELKQRGVFCDLCGSPDPEYPIESSIKNVDLCTRCVKNVLGYIPRRFEKIDHVKFQAFEGAVKARIAEGYTEKMARAWVESQQNVIKQPRRLEQA